MDERVFRKRRSAARNTSPQFTRELRHAFIADAVSGIADHLAVGKHPATGFDQAKLVLELHGVSEVMARKWAWKAERLMPAASVNASVRTGSS